jgi:hypothetical protein
VRKPFIVNLLLRTIYSYIRLCYCLSFYCAVESLQTAPPPPLSPQDAEPVYHVTSLERLVRMWAWATMCSHRCAFSDVPRPPASQHFLFLFSWHGPTYAIKDINSSFSLKPAATSLRHANSVGKVRFGPVLSQLSLNAEPDPWFGSGSFPEC